MDIQTLHKAICYLDVEIDVFVEMMEEKFNVKLNVERVEKKPEGSIVFSIGSKDLNEIVNKDIKILGKEV